MKIPTGNGIPPFAGAVQPHPTRPASPVSAQETDPARHFDQITITARDAGASPFEAELKSRLTQSVHQTAATTGALTALRKEILSGEYRPDPSAIAKKMLLMVEE